MPKEALFWSRPGKWQYQGRLRVSGCPSKGKAMAGMKNGPPLDREKRGGGRRMERCGSKCRGLAVSPLAECAPRLAHLACLSASRITDSDIVIVAISLFVPRQTQDKDQLVASWSPMRSSVIARKRRRMLSPHDLTSAKACILRQRAADSRQYYLSAFYWALLRNGRQHRLFCSSPAPQIAQRQWKPRALLAEAGHVRNPPPCLSVPAVGLLRPVWEVFEVQVQLEGALLMRRVG